MSFLFIVKINQWDVLILRLQINYRLFEVHVLKRQPRFARLDFPIIVTHLLFVPRPKCWQSCHVPTLIVLNLNMNVSLRGAPYRNFNRLRERNGAFLGFENFESARVRSQGQIVFIIFHRGIELDVIFVKV